MFHKMFDFGSGLAGACGGKQLYPTYENSDWASRRSRYRGLEMIGFTIDQICFWVSGISADAG
jgi:hypothetical protein